MSKLSPEAAAILAAARKDLDASSAEVAARVRSAVAARVEAEAPASAVRSRTIWSAVARPGPIVALAFLGAALATKVVASSSTKTPTASESPSDVHAKDVRPTLPPSADQPPSELADPIPTFSVDSLPDHPDRPVPAPGRRGNPSGPRIAAPTATVPEIDNAKAPAMTTDALLAESRLLRAAQVELQAHRGDAAMRSLEEHAARFPNGVLREERLTLRVLVLCETGAIEAARRARGELDRSFPATSHASRLANSCAASESEGAR